MPDRAVYSEEQFAQYLNKEDTLESWHIGMTPEEKEAFIHFQMVQGTEPGMDPFL